MELLQQYFYFLQLLPRVLSTSAACSSSPLSGADLTLSVRQKLDEMSNRAELGGGQKRIDSQHQKVKDLFFSFWACE